ncbi:hypothetical protein SCRM01_231 [Synechococcus phage S-CRM01]|uniref:hypothetical protein n=1 Tax=Synechococcus phage S-CRM01 TaxID=1026955 RepID=UPI000209E438|nr:hypothetical protein SCRM01_231 [Synechococcus phage S-CRM01]AEC53177.1 hypothetical protein SCRM01_231 [Synechococcus phage S-CRM01]
MKSQIFEVVVNRCYGGFGLSNDACDRLVELGYTGLKRNPNYGKHSWEPKYYGDTNIDRHHPLLVQVVRELGKKANGECAQLEIDKVYGLYRIKEYDGMESIVEYGEDDWVSPAFY